MEHLGLCGIIKLSTQIIVNNLKHFVCIALIFAFPFAFITSLIVLGPFCNSIHSLVAFLSLLYELSSSAHTPLPPSHLTFYDEAIFTKPYLQPPSSFISLSLLFIFSFLLSLLCRPLVAFSVCRACMNKTLDLKGSLRGLARSAMNLMFTGLCEGAVFLAFGAATMLVMVIISTVLSVVDVDATVAMTMWTMGVIGGGVYMAAGWSLAEAVAILEEKKGWEAMRRSVYLIEGKKGIAIGMMYIGYGGMGMVPFVVCVCVADFEVWRWRMVVGLQGVIALFSITAHVVLYMSCKRQREEPLDTLMAAASA